MRGVSIDISTGAAGAGLLIFLALVLAACGGQNQWEPTMVSEAGELEQTRESGVGTASLAQQSYFSGLVHFEKQDYELAINDFDEAIRQDPSYGLAYSTKGKALIHLGHYQLAIGELDDAIRLEPRFAMAYRNRAVAYVGLGEEGRGIDDYDIAIRLDPQFGLAYADRAIAYTYIANDAAAQRDLELAVEFGISRAVLESVLQTIREDR